MNTFIRRAILVLLMTILCGVVFHAPLSVGIGSLFPGAELGVKAWKEVLLLFSFVLVVVEVTRRHQWQTLWNDWVIRLIAAYCALHFVSLPFMWHGLDPTTAALMIDLRFVVFLGVVYVACKLHPSWRRPLIIGSSIAAGVSLLFALLQVTVLPHDILSSIGYSKETIAPYTTVDQNHDYIRINGTLRGPNPLGVYAVMILVASIVVLLKKRAGLQSIHRFLPWGVGLLGVSSTVALWFSYSRSALLGALFALVVTFVCLYGRRISRMVWISLGIGALVMIGGLYTARDVPFVSQVILHEDPNEGGNVNSNDGHWASLVDGTSRMIRQPFGAGVASTGSPSLMTDQGLIIENYYLYVAHEVGWLGLILFIGLCGGVLYQLWVRRTDWLACSLFAGGIGLVVASLFLPVWADDTVSLVWWGLAGVALATPLVMRKKEAQHG